MDSKPGRATDGAWWVEARAIAARHARGASDASDDLAQDLAVAALEVEAPLERPGAWLERVGRNATIDRGRVERRRRELAPDVERPAPGPDPEGALLARERRGLVRSALLALPRSLRRATLARYHGDLSFEDVAAKLGTPPVTARTRVHRALVSLRERLAGMRSLVPVWPGVQGTALGLALVAGVARPALFPAASAPVVAAAAPSSMARQPGVRFDVAQVRAPIASKVSSPEARRSAPASRGAAVPQKEAPARAVPAVQTFSFDDDVVSSELARPDAVDIVSLPATPHLSLIELRWQLLPELVKSFEDL